MAFERTVALLATTAIFTVMTSGQALAQTAQSAEATALGEVLVTATRQSSSIDRVPMSMTAVTQRNLDQQGVRSIGDISRITPGVTLRRSDNNNNSVFIRGIIASGIGAPTTGLYLDDTALQKYNGSGAVTGNGASMPLLFDLERVEVLRGPQGTLYGGASLGGTVRLITPSPSLTTYSGYFRGQGSSTQDGAGSYEGGAAIGGPIIQDKLGFRIAVFQQYQGGFMDHIDQYSMRRTVNNSNSNDARSIRAALAWAATPDLTVTASVYASFQLQKDATTAWLKVKDATTVPTRCWTATGTETTQAAANRNYCLPAYTYGPYPFYGPGKVGGSVTSPATTRLYTPNLVVDWDLKAFSVKSITSYMQDQQKGRSAGQPSNNTTSLQNGVMWLYVVPESAFSFNYNNKRRAISEEFRISSPAGKRLSWIVGAYYVHSIISAYNYSTEDLENLARKLRGISAAQLFGVGTLPVDIGSIRDQGITEDGLAGFGQASLQLTSKLKLTGGVRISREKLSYRELHLGAISGYLVATPDNGGYTEGSQKESPVTPMAGVEYQLSERNMVYFTASQGFRKGGVNLVMPLSCATSLAVQGGVPTPRTFKADTAWSYEGGAKLRLFGNRAQVNSSLFYISWKDIQSSVGLPAAPGPTCTYNYAVNAGKAVSKGGDVQASLRLFEGMSATVGVAYTNAQYVGNFYANALPGRVPGLLIGDGNRLATPPWSANLGIQYERPLWDRYSGYFRLDYQYTSPYKNGLGPGTTTYNPDTYVSPKTEFMTLRAGIQFTGWDIALFVNNLTNSKDILQWGSGGRTGCSDLACTTSTRYNPLYRATFFRPREIGINTSYRF